MKPEYFEMLKESADPMEFYKIGSFYYRAGSYGLTKYKRTSKEFIELSHVNDFRNKTLSEVNKIFKNL